MRCYLRVLFVAIVSLCCTSCGSSVPASTVPIAVDTASFVCNELEQHWQDEPGYVKFACALVPFIPRGAVVAPSAGPSASASTPPLVAAPAASAPQTIIVKVPAVVAPQFRATHAAPRS